jgi:hypothetical protein
LISKKISTFLIGKHIKKPFIITSDSNGVSTVLKRIRCKQDILVEKISKHNKLDIPALLLKNYQDIRIQLNSI